MAETYILIGKHISGFVTKAHEVEKQQGIIIISEHKDT